MKGHTLVIGKCTYQVPRCFKKFSRWPHVYFDGKQILTRDGQRHSIPGFELRRHSPRRFALTPQELKELDWQNSNPGWWELHSKGVDVHGQNIHRGSVRETRNFQFMQR